jgi:biotin carboxylase
MNLLVTNTRNPQAYAIIRSLRPYSEKLVVAMDGKNRLDARLSHAANSRLVDKRYYVPSPMEDWRSGTIQKENTEREEVFIQSILGICEREEIDTVFPSFDAHVYVFSKNKERFAKVGVLITTPDFEAVITPLDKYRTIQAAEEVGFPCPKTFLPRNEDDVRHMANELGFPLIMKRRFSAAGRGMRLVRNLPELLNNAGSAGENLGTFIMQEYIPGRLNDNFSMTLDKAGELKMAFCRKALCHFGRFCQIWVVDSPVSHPSVVKAAKMIQKLGWWGGITVQTKVDSRDHTPKLIEINPRIGSGLWHRTEAGINEPLMILQIARGKEVEPVGQYPVGTVFADPVEHSVRFGLALADLLIYRFRVGVLGKQPLDRHNPAMPLRELIHSIRQTYFSGRKRLSSPYTKYFFRDPLVAIIWWVQFITRRWIQNLPRELGR